jgi:hypothetical protein
MPIACALLMRRLPVSASRWSTVSRTPGFADSDWLDIAQHKYFSHEKQVTTRTAFILCGKCSSDLGRTTLGVNTGQQQHRDKDERGRHKGKIGRLDRHSGPCGAQDLERSIDVSLSADLDGYEA